MARRPRHYLPGYPYHIVQRGNNREACFLERRDYQVYLTLWEEVSRRYGALVHAYCLMTNHVHFLITGESGEAISNTFRTVGSRYAAYFNWRHGRTGTLWEGRHKHSLVQTERYLFCCYRYIELNPVRAGMVVHPGDYEWSSFGHNARGEASWITPHAEYLRLGNSDDERCESYRRLLQEKLSGEELEQVREASRQCLPLGDDGFQRSIEQRYAIALGRKLVGRPRKQSGSA